MKLGFIGLPGGGKTTCFSIVTGRPMDELHAAPGEARMAVVKIPDDRLPRVAEIYKSAKSVQAELTFVDCVSLHKGEDGGAREEKITRVAGDADSFALTIQCFGVMDYDGNTLDPRSDLETLVLEMILTDLAIVEGRIARIDADLKSSRDKTNWERDLIERVRDHLMAEGFARDLTFTQDEAGLIRGFSLLTMKPWLVIFNVADDDLAGERAADAKAFADESGLAHVTISAELEREIAELPEDEAAEFMSDYGLEEPAREHLIRACNEEVGVVSYFTAGPVEARAWTIVGGANARDAAGKIHTDLYDGFIRAQVIPFEAIDELGSEAACREAGVVRLEGRDYIVTEGDLLDIRFSR